MIYFLSNTIIPDVEFRTCSLEDCIDDLWKSEYLFVDTEAKGFDPYTCDLLCIQIDNGRGVQYVIDTSVYPIEHLKSLLESKVLVGHNLKFDLRFLYVHGVYPMKVEDTFINEMVLTTGLVNHRRSLDACVQRYLKVTLNKEIRGIIHREGLSQRVIKYAADDVVYLPELLMKQKELLIKQGLEKTARLENRFVPALSYVEMCGMKIDVSQWKERLAGKKKQQEEIAKLLDQEVIGRFQGSKFVSNQLDLFNPGLSININWGSSKQVIEFFKELGIEAKVKDKDTGIEKNTVDIKAISAFRDKDPIIPLYIEYKGLDKEISTYGDSFLEMINPKTRRIHTTYRQIMDTGRMSSGDAKKGYPNLQNIPADETLRRCFIAEPGNSLIVSDYSGQEICVFVNKSLEPKMLDFFNSGESDMHSFIAKQIFTNLKDKTLTEIKKEFPDKRQTAKVGAFAILYGAVPMTLAKNLGIPMEDAEAFYNGYFENFTAVKQYFKTSSAQVLRDGYILIDNVTNRKSYVAFFDEFKKTEAEVQEEGFWDTYREEKAKNSELFQKKLSPLVRSYFKKKSEIERSSVNYRIQGTSASITKIAGFYLYEHIVQHDLLNVVKIVNIVHDELVVECPTPMAEEMAKVVQSCMEKAGTFFCKTIPLKAEPKISDCWLK